MHGSPCWVDIAADVHAATAFYSGLFDWRVDVTPTGRGDHAVCYLADRPVAGIRPRHDDTRPAWVPAVHIDDVTATTTSIGRAGGHVLAATEFSSDVGRVGLAADPQGATFGLVERDLRTEDTAEPGTPVWTEYRTSDLAGARRFYKDVFGYLFQNAGPAGYVTFLPRTGGLALGGFGATTSRAAWHTYFSVADTDETAAKVEELGGTVCAPPQDNDFGRVATVTDDQGAEFVIVSAARTQPGFVSQTDKSIVTICG